MAVTGSQEEALGRLDVATPSDKQSANSELAEGTTSRLWDKPQPAAGS